MKAPSPQGDASVTIMSSERGASAAKVLETGPLRERQRAASHVRGRSMRLVATKCSLDLSSGRPRRRSTLRRLLASSMPVAAACSASAST
eukprot:9846449-Heterocapsa_arctica.AAC.1